MYNSAIWQFGNLAIWQFGDLAIWQFGDLAVWQFGNLAIWHFPNTGLDPPRESGSGWLPGYPCGPHIHPRIKTGWNFGLRFFRKHSRLWVGGHHQVVASTHLPTHPAQHVGRQRCAVNQKTKIHSHRQKKNRSILRHVAYRFELVFDSTRVKN